MKDTEFKISLFADNTSIFLYGLNDSLNNTPYELERFAKISGLKINFDKTQVVWVGSKNTVQTQLERNGNCHGDVKALKYWV